MCTFVKNMVELYLAVEKLIVDACCYECFFNLLQENFNLKHIADAPLDRPDPQSTCDKERLRGLRKRCRKLRLRLTQRSVMHCLHEL